MSQVDPEGFAVGGRNKLFTLLTRRREVPFEIEVALATGNLPKSYVMRACCSSREAEQGNPATFKVRGCHL